MIIPSSYIGIDPGKQGAIVVIANEEIVEHYLEPSGTLLWKVIEKYNPRAIYIEKAQTMPRQGIVSAFNYGQHFGELVAAIEISQTRHYQVAPRRWQYNMFIGTKEMDSPKFRAATAFRRIFPDYCQKIENRNGKLHDGVVDAALIALYGTKHL